MTIEIDTMETYNTYDTSGEEEARAIWRALPRSEAYPIGSRWAHPSRSGPVTIVGYVGDSGLLVEGNEYPAGNPGEWWRNSLDTYGRPALPETGEPDHGTMEVTLPASTTEDEPLSRYSRVDVGTRVRLIDGGGDGSSSAVVGDTGTVEDDRNGLLDVRMDDGHLTSRHTDRWAKVTMAVEDATDGPFARGDRVRILKTGSGLREEWHGMEATYVGTSDPSRTPHPFEVAFDADSDVRAFTGSDGLEHGYVTELEKVESEPFPVGYKFHTIEGHDDERFEVIEVDSERGVRAQGNQCESPQWFTVEKVAAATPITEEVSEEVEEDTMTETTEPVEAPVEPWKPSVGDRVVVVRDDDSPSNNGKEATVLQVNENNMYAKYQVDYSPNGYSSWWVNEVRPLMPANETEFRAMLDAAKETARQEGVEAGRKEGRDAATQEAAEQMDRIVESAHEYASRNELCRQFDLFMVENGLRPRDSFTRPYTVEYSETFDARDEDHAREQALEALNNANSWNGQFDIELNE